MKRSFSYYLTIAVIRIKGIKKHFSTDPINYLKLRASDVYIPQAEFFSHNRTITFYISETKITQVTNKPNPNKLLIFIHGGAFVSGPSQHHWDAIEKIAKATNCTIWMCDYPKAPESKISQISSNIDLVYEQAKKNFLPENITLMGDSAGGTLIIALIQRLIQNENVLPSRLFLISPVLDASFTNSTIEEIDKLDPMLSKKGVLSAKKMCADGEDLKDSRISPLFGNFMGFPKTYLFMATHDITYPDQLLFCEKLETAKVENIIYVGEGMPHIWPLLPFMKESQSTLNKIIQLLNS